MNISGTLHLYSGDDREMFFVFDDDVAQLLYRMDDFEIGDLGSRSVYISVGADRYIHRRTMSFSRKQTEIKVSLCSRNTKDGLGSLTALYEWFAPPGLVRPDPFLLIGTLDRNRHNDVDVWELRLTEPIGLVTPPGLAPHVKARTAPRRAWQHRRLIDQRNLRDIGWPAEELAARIAEVDFPSPRYACLWRNKYLDSERSEIRALGIIADIDIWDADVERAELFIEVKAQKITAARTTPAFFLSQAEWRSYRKASEVGCKYQIWLFQYEAIADFTNRPSNVKLVVFDRLEENWLQAERIRSPTRRR